MNNIKYFRWLLVLSSIYFYNNCSVIAQSDYQKSIDYINNYDFTERIVPEIPVKDKQIRVIIDTDAHNEVDDQWAITLALLTLERFKIEGFVAVSYADPSAGNSGIQLSYEEIELILKKTGFEGKYPIYKGAHPMRYAYEPSTSEGVDFIIEQAKKSSPDDPIWVISLGSATNIASAILLDPSIANNIISFCHGRTQWPYKCLNYNVYGDIHAAKILFHFPVLFVLFDTGSHLYCPMEESEKYVKPYGEIGEFLHERRYVNSVFILPTKGFFDLGDIAALIDPELAYWEVAESPEVDLFLNYRFNNKKGRLLRCFHIDRGKTFDMFYSKLKNFHEKEKNIIK